MKLNRAQIQAIATDFCKSANAGIEQEIKRRQREGRAVWDKTPDGKLFAKLPGWMKSRLEGYAVNEKVARVWKGEPIRQRIEVSAIEREIIMATIDAVSMEDLMKRLNKKFKP